jgi:hypothetical protein
MTAPTPNHRWYHVTPARFFVGLLAVQVFLLLSERFRWFASNDRNGWAVLIAIGVVFVAVLVMLLRGLVYLCLRRRFQFGVRSLLLFMVLVSIPLGWFAWEMREARRQSEAVEAIVDVGGSVAYQVDEYGFPIYDAKPDAPVWLRKLLGNEYSNDVVAVCIGDLDDSLMVHVKELPQLKSLECCYGYGVTDAGLANLRALTQLKRLDLNGAQVTDAGLIHLERLTQLRTLRLGGSKLTDAAVGSLCGLEQLEYLFLRGSRVTHKGVKKLRETLPDCEIRR